MPNLPPVAQAVAVILGVALAIIRLLTASKPFWNVLPNKLQKAIPALLVAVGLLPAALEHAQSWLDVATAAVLVIGSYFTASRGDQNPPKDSDGGPRLERVNSDPRLTRDELAPPPSLRPEGGADAELSDGSSKKWWNPAWRPRYVLGPAALAAFGLVAFVVVLSGCGASTPPKPPSDAATLAAITARCSAEAFACGQKGGTEAECTSACDAEIDRRAEACR